LNLLGVLSKFSVDEICPVVFTGTDCPQNEIEALTAFKGVEVIQTERFSSISHRSEMVCSMLLGRDFSATKLFEKHGIDVVFEAAQFFGWRFKIPAIAWIPDFQHRGLPEMFSPLYRLKRNFGQGLQIRTGRTVMLSSDDARRTCEQIYPRARGQTHTVRFAILPQIPPSIIEARKTASSHGLTTPFFYMPNQFWRHKNHLLVIEALAILRDRGCRIVVAASGQQIDPIAPGHFDVVHKKIIDLGLEENFRILGLIPREHIPRLMRTCEALLNPSLFEGWSTTVEEARLLGIPMILSDLPVHREQMGKDALYFNRKSAHDLADCLQSFVSRDENQREEDLIKAQRQAEKRARAFAKSFEFVVNVAMQSIIVL
jgi:glycosyltransferase involved in cell wall biosynthesis